MDCPTPHALLEAWERGSGETPTLRGLCLLQAMEPSRSLEDLAGLSLVERDERIRALRRHLIGSRYEAIAHCPACQEQVEIGFADHELPVWSGAHSPGVPTSLDLLEVSRLPSPERVSALASRCIAPEENDLGIFDLQIDVRCPTCEKAWQEPFDIVVYFWSELASWCGRLLWEVHALARSYGWTEREVLSMTPIRRSQYLRMVATG